MSNGVKKSKTPQKNSMIEIAFMNASVEKGGKILEEMLEGNSILEFAIHEAEMSIKLDTNGIDKDGNRYDPESKYIISIKGKKEQPKTKKRANLPKAKTTVEKDNDDLTH